MKSAGTSPNCMRMGDVGNRNSALAGKRNKSPFSRTTYDPLVDPRSRTEAVPLLFTVNMACRLDIDLV
jgi:hypothetical protein